MKLITFMNAMLYLAQPTVIKHLPQTFVFSLHYLNASFLVSPSLFASPELIPTPAYRVDHSRRSATFCCVFKEKESVNFYDKTFSQRSVSVKTREALFFKWKVVRLVRTCIWTEMELLWSREEFSPVNKNCKFAPPLTGTILAADGASAAQLLGDSLLDPPQQSCLHLGIDWDSRADFIMNREGIIHTFQN